MTKLTRLPDGRVDLEGWTLDAIEAPVEAIQQMALKAAAEALEWLFSKENEEPPQIKFAVHWDPDAEDPLEVQLTLPVNFYEGPAWSFTLGALVDDLARVDEEDLSKAQVERVAVALEGLATRLRALRGKAP